MKVNLGIVIGQQDAEAQLHGLGVSGCTPRHSEREDRLQQRGGPLDALFAYSLGQQIDNGTLDLTDLTDKG
jgi:hypothetical protein